MPEVFLESVRHIKELSPAFDRNLPGHHGWPVDKAAIDDYEVCAAGILDGSAEMVGGDAVYGRIRIAIK